MGGGGGVVGGNGGQWRLWVDVGGAGLLCSLCDIWYSPFFPVSPPFVTSGLSDPFVLEEVVCVEVVWEEMVAVGGCGRNWRFSSLSCGVW